MRMNQRGQPEPFWSTTDVGQVINTPKFKNDGIAYDNLDIQMPLVKVTPNDNTRDKVCTKAVTAICKRLSSFDNCVALCMAMQLRLGKDSMAGFLTVDIMRKIPVQAVLHSDTGSMLQNVV